MTFSVPPSASCPARAPSCASRTGPAPDADLIGQLRLALHQLPADLSTPQALDQLIRQQLDDLPAPAQGTTLQRWRALATVAQHDLTLAQLYESHVDARAILQECSPAERWPSGLGGVWTDDEDPLHQSRVVMQGELRGFVQLFGRKSLCVGAGNVAHPLVTAWSPTGAGPFLVLVDPHDSTMRLEPHLPSPMTHTADPAAREPARYDVVFEGAGGRIIADDGKFLSRPGFWHSRGGMAAMWYGAVSGAAQLLRAHLTHHHEVNGQDKPADPLRVTALGHLDMSLCASAALLRETAEWIDHHPQQDAAGHVVRLWSAIERTAREVMGLTGRVLGTRRFPATSALGRCMRDLSACAQRWDGERAMMALGERALADTSAWAL